MNRNDAKNTFVIYNNNQDNYIRVDKRTFDKFIDNIYDGFENEHKFKSLYESGAISEPTIEALQRKYKIQVDLKPTRKYDKWVFNIPYWSLLIISLFNFWVVFIK